MLDNAVNNKMIFMLTPILSRESKTRANDRVLGGCNLLIAAAAANDSATLVNSSASNAADTGKWVES